jgi:hypothetical protein
MPFALSALEPTEDASKSVILYVLFVLNGGLTTWIGLRFGLDLSVTTFGFLTPATRG